MSTPEANTSWVRVICPRYVARQVSRMFVARSRDDVMGRRAMLRGAFMSEFGKALAGWRAATRNYYRARSAFDPSRRKADWLLSANSRPLSCGLPAPRQQVANG